MLLFILIGGLFLAYANGANDNFKGVSTLYGSEELTYRQALIYSSFATFLGVCTAIFLSKGLISTFSGKGLVLDSVLNNPAFSLSVILGASLTVMLATRFGFPVSTTHALTGGLVGAGMSANFSGVNFSKLGTAFFMPLILSPLISLILSYLLSNIFLRTKKINHCACEVACVENNEALTFKNTLVLDESEKCEAMGATEVISIKGDNLVRGVHLLSAGSVCFARGLNDTPKLAGLIILSNLIPINFLIILIGVTMVIGGLVHSKKIAQTMSKNITTMSHETGAVSNLITALVVNFGSNFSMPVSTTHVSCGTIFGIGLKQKTAKMNTIVHILLAWLVTLPMAAMLGWFLFSIIGKKHG